ncbi:MAG TPA: carbon-nitrogen hydrolase family protein [Anaerolineaceae bacterium]
MPRIVRIATIAQGNQGGPTIEANRQRMAGLIELALADKPDIIAIPESFTLADLAEPRIEEMAEAVPGPTLDMAAAYARANHVYILCPILAWRADGLHIEAFLLDRTGQISGSYQKHHPVVEGCGYTKLEFGSRPGNGTPVFDTDFGRIGVQICFDIEYRDGWDALDRAGAEIFFWLSAYDGGRDLSAMAWNYHRYVASAVQTTHARILNTMGETLSITGVHEPVAYACVDLDVVLFHMDFNKSQIPAIRKKYGPDISLTIYHEEGYFTLQSKVESLPVSAIIQEFQLDPLKDYLERNRLMEDAIRAGVPLPDLNPPYSQRTQWV